LRTEWLVLSLSLARKFLESVIAELGAPGMRADGKDIFEPRLCSTSFTVCFKVVIVADMLPQVIHTPKSVGASMKLAVLARILGIFIAK
jgi:hypothetical protein